jgi:hypothetical protein
LLPRDFDPTAKALRVLYRLSSAPGDGRSNRCPTFHKLRGLSSRHDLERTRIMRKVKWLVVAGSLVVMASAVAMFWQPRAAADGYGADRWGGDRGFSTRSIKGSFGFSTNGFGMLLAPTAPQPVPAATLGRIVFDGNGGCSISLWANIGGQTTQAQSGTCSYTVNPDGTGTNEATFPGSPIVDPIPIVFVIVDDAREIRLLNTGSIVSTITARRQ